MEKFNKDDAYKNLERVHFWIENSDSKTSFILAFIGILVGLSLSNSKFIDGIISAIQELNQFDSKTLFAILLIFGLLLLITTISFSVYYLIKVLTATIDPAKKEIKNRFVIKDSLLHFYTINNRKKFTEFEADLKNLNEKKLIKDINSQTYINSIICTLKFENYKSGIKYLKSALLVIVYTIIMFFIFVSIT